MKFLCTALTLNLVLSATAFSQQSEPISDKKEKPKIVLDDVLLYDGDLSKERFHAPWIRQDTQGQYVDDTDAVNCGHLKVASTKEYRSSSLLDSKSYYCYITIVGFDFSNRGLLVLVDLAKNIRGNGAKYPPVARYLARFYGTPIDFFSEVLTKQTDGSKLANLAAAMNHLSRSIKSVGQDRYIDGSLLIERKGKMKWDPHGVDFIFPNNLRDPDRTFFLTSNEFIEINLVGSATDRKKFPKPEAVFAAMKETMNILSEGYATLQQASDERVKDDFKNFIAENAEVISRDLKKAIELMRRKPYHPMELIHFVNQISALIKACDDILESKVGSNPDFITILNSQEKGDL